MRITLQHRIDCAEVARRAFQAEYNSKRKTAPAEELSRLMNQIYEMANKRDRLILRRAVMGDDALKNK